MQLLLYQPRNLPVTLISREGVNQGDTLLTDLYKITLVPPVEELWAADPGFIAPFYADDATFDGLARRRPQLLKLLI